MLKRNFDPGFRIELHQKDLNLALEGAQALGPSLLGTAAAEHLFNACTALGGQSLGPFRNSESAGSYGGSKWRLPELHA